jgi:hypothetical protein
VFAALLEGDTGAGDDVSHRVRDEHLARAGGRRDSRPDVDRGSTDGGGRLLDLARVDAGAGFER